jgi:hypothetical protein
LLFKLRRDIRSTLRRKRHFAFFPEDEIKSTRKASLFSANTVEQAIFDNSDLIVLLLTPGGATSEAEQIGAVAAHAAKTVVLVDRKARKSYIAAGLLSQKKNEFAVIHWYANPADIDSGAIVAIVMQEADRRQESKFSGRRS